MVRVLLFRGLIVMLVIAMMFEESTSMTNFIEKVMKLQLDGSMLILKQLVSKHEHRLDIIKGLVNKLGELSGEEIRDPNFTVHHPLNAFRFIRNHSVIYNETATKLIEEIRLYEQERKEIDKISNNLPTVQSNDIEETIHSMLELQLKYTLKTTDVANGIYQGPDGNEMTAEECQDMMVGAYQLQKFKLAWEWMGEALKKVSKGDVSTNANEILNKAVEMVAKVHPKTPGTLLFCEYTSKKHPLLLYRPAKLELLSLDPYIAVYHDLFSRDILTKLVKSVMEQEKENKPLYRKTVSSRSGARRVRINTSSWQKQKDRQGIREIGNTSEREYIYRYIQALTSLEPDTFKDLKISGGKYYKDVVSYQDNQKMPDSKDCASFRIYLTDVHIGGATVFTDIGEIVSPAAGKAIFWYNGGSNNRISSGKHVVEFPAIAEDKWILSVRIQNYKQCTIK